MSQLLEALLSFLTIYDVATCQEERALGKAGDFVEFCWHVTFRLVHFVFRMTFFRMTYKRSAVSCGVKQGNMKGVPGITRMLDHRAFYLLFTSSDLPKRCLDDLEEL